MTLGADAQGAPEIVVTESGFNIVDGRIMGGNHYVNGTTTFIFVVQNTGTAPLTGFQLTTDGPDADFISFGERPAATVAAGGNTYFRMYFHPTRVGAFTAHLHLTSNDADESPFDISFIGNSVTNEPELSVQQPAPDSLENGTTHSFGTTPQGMPVTLTFTLKNDGGGSLSNLSTSISGTHASDYVITQLPASELLINSISHFKVRFTPSSAGVRGATLTITSNDADENPFVLQLTGTGSASAPDLQVQHPAGNTLAYNATSNYGSVNGSLSRTFTLINTGGDSLLNVAASISGTHASDFVLTQNPATSLAAGAITSCTVLFTPSAAALRTAVLSIASNDPNESPFVVQLSGTGSLTPPDIQVSDHYGSNLANNSTFGFGYVGGTLLRNFTLRNTGTSILTDVAASITGDHASDFELTIIPAVTVAGSVTTFCRVQFTPSASGLRTAILTISSNDPDENPYRIQLTGTKAEPEITVTDVAGTSMENGAILPWGPTAVSSPLTKTFQIRNTGLANLNLAASLNGLHASDYVIQSYVPPVLGPNVTVTINVVVTPSGPGVRQAELTITSNDADENPFVIQLAGRGPTPDISVQIPYYTVDDDDTYSFGVVHTAASQDLQFTVHNSGTHALTGLAISTDGPHASDYVITQALPLTQLAPGAQTTFTVKFAPSGVGLRTAALRILSDDPDESPFDIQLTGEGIQPHFVLEDDNGVAVATDTLLDFGSVAFGQTGKRDFTIRNTGTTALIFSYTEWTSGSATRFGSSNLYQVQVQPGASRAFSVTFTPRLFGPLSESLRILSNDAEASPFELRLTGIGLRPGLRLELPVGSQAPALYSFDGREVGSESELTFRISNVGNAPLIHSVTITGTHAADYSIRTAPQSPVGPNQSTDFTVVFSPKALGTRQAYLEITHNGGTGSAASSVSGGWFSGAGVLSKVSFLSTSYTASHGDKGAVVTLRRSPAEVPVTVQMDITDGAVQTMPPMVSAIAGTDYTPLAGAAAQVSFAAGEAQKTVAIPLLSPVSRAGINKRLNLTLSNPSAGAELKAPTAAVLSILAKDSTKPTLTLSAPLAGKVRSLEDTITVSGKVGDAKGISSLTLKLNDAAPVPVPLLSYTTLTSIPFELVITPLVGPNEITLTAVDPLGNSTTLKRSFTFARLRKLNVTTVDSGTELAMPAAAITLATLPAGFATPLVSAGASAPGKACTVEEGAQVTLTAAAPRGYAFSHWDCAPNEFELTSRLGPQVTFTMPAENLIFTAMLMRVEDSQLPSKTISLHCLMDPDPNSAGNPAMMGYLSGTLTPTGTFTGKLQMRGQTLPVNAVCHDNADAVFTVAGKKRDSLPVPGGRLVLTLQLESALIVNYWADDGESYSHGVTQQAPYGTTNKVPAGLLNSATQGFYTLRLDPFSTQLSQSAYPRGNGYATAKLTATGQVSLTGVLPDGTAITCSSVLLEDGTAPVYLPLLTPGGTTKDGLLFGRLQFASSGEPAYLTSSLQWFRPEAAAPKVLLYPAGWPSGITLEVTGWHYDSRLTVESMLALEPPAGGAGNASLRFSGGNLSATLTRNNFSIVKNAVVKITPVDGSYTLMFTPSTGLFSGTFTPDGSNPGSAKPSFKGVLLQNTGLRGGHGFFLNNAKGEPAPESGEVILGRPLP